MNSYNRHSALKGNKLLALATLVLAVAVVLVVIFLYHKSPAAVPVSKTVTDEHKSSSVTVASSMQSTLAISSQAASSDVKTLSGNLFIGDSFTQSLISYEKPDKTEVISNDELTAYSAINHTYTFGSGKQNIADAAAAKSPEKIFILLGSNDIANGYSSSKFAGYYGQFVSNLKSKIPGVKIYVQSIFPVTEKYESKKHSGTSVTNKKIDDFNAALQAMCKSGGATYLDVSSVVKGTDGKLPSSASTDGIHFTKSYYQKWFDYLKKVQ